MFRSEDIPALQARYGLSYHVVYAQEAAVRVGLAGKSVIEIGGSLPRGFALDELGAASWIGIEETSYWEEVARAEGAKQGWTGAKPLAEATPGDAAAPYGVLLGRIEDAPPALESRFDIAFSIAAFEHMDRFPASLEGIHRVLKPGGVLFSLFAPLWSAPDGHHLPVIRDAAGRPFDRGLIPPWGHLLMSPPEMLRHLCTLTDRRTAVEIVYYIYQSPHINRLFPEDYSAFVADSPFRVERMGMLFPAPVTPDIQARLEKRWPGRSLFGANGMLMILRRDA